MGLGLKGIPVVCRSTDSETTKWLRALVAVVDFVINLARIKGSIVVDTVVMLRNNNMALVLTGSAVVHCTLCYKLFYLLASFFLIRILYCFCTCSRPCSATSWTSIAGVRSLRKTASVVSKV